MGMLSFLLVEKLWLFSVLRPAGFMLDGLFTVGEELCAGWLLMMFVVFSWALIAFESSCTELHSRLPQSGSATDRNPLPMAPGTLA